MSINQIRRVGEGLYINRYVDVCRNCKGDGRVTAAAYTCADTPAEPCLCPLCGGTGRVIITKEITVRIEPYHSMNT